MKLARLPKLPGKDRVAHGMSLASSKPYGGKVSHEEVDAAPVEKVPFDDLKAVQKSVGVARVADYIEQDGKAPAGRTSGKSGYPRDLPIVVETAGQKYVHDGHHRVLANRLLGRNDVEARVVRIQLSPLKRWAARD